jgi:SAM-dependent methyltransferase
MTTDPRQHSPAAERNREPLLAMLRGLLPVSGLALEIASGTGQHAAHFAMGLPGWTWQPSDPAPQSLPSISAWCAGLPNVRPPLQIDVLTAAEIPAPAAASLDLVFCANMLHIAPWACCPALMTAAARWLRPGGCLVTYGPYDVDGEPMAAGNLAFDADLRARNPAWGLRRLSQVCQAAEATGLRLVQRVPMPANNLSLVFKALTATPTGTPA